MSHDTKTNSGKILPNGATVIIMENEYVLALFNGQFVTWTHDDYMGCYQGHYFGDDIKSAMNDFIHRAYSN